MSIKFKGIKLPIQAESSFSFYFPQLFCTFAISLWYQPQLSAKPGGIRYD